MTLPVLSVEHLFRALEPPGASPCVQLLRVPQGARAFVASVLAKRLARPVLFLVASDEEAEETARELRAYFGDDAVALFPSVETAPYELLAPYPRATHDRLRAIHALRLGKLCAVVAPAEGLYRKTMPPAAFDSSVRTIRFGDTVDVAELCRTLAEVGYGRLPASADPGDFSVRGGIVDIFSPAHPFPARLLLDGDTVESIRWFNTATQRTFAPGGPNGDEVESVAVIPCSEVVTSPAFVDAALAAGAGPFADTLSEGIRGHGVDALLPRLYGSASSLLDHLPAGAIVVAVNAVNVLAETRRLFDEAKEMYELSGKEAVLPPPSDLFVDEAAIVHSVASRPFLSFDALETTPLSRADLIRGELGIRGNDDIRTAVASGPAEGLLFPLVEEAKGWWKRDARFLLSSLSPSQVDRMEDLLSRYSLPLHRFPSVADALSGPPGVSLVVSEVTRGFRSAEHGVALVTEAELFGEKTRARRHRREEAVADPMEEFSLHDLRVNDLVVHVDHGVGVYRGLMRRNVAGIDADFLVVEYAGGDRLFVPVGKMDRIQRYAASEESRPTLAKLGGTAWQRAREKVRESLLAMAHELVAIQAKRELATRSAPPSPAALFREFEAAFHHEETPDQQKVIDEVVADLCAPRPMDRLVCGDVGYGKTEVAIRAAFKVVLDGRQAAILVPTTVLAEQHHHSFKKRFEGYPVRVESLSRFRTKDEAKAVVADLKTGKVDIVIGTHRLLSKDIVFKDLGLVVIDEEHRFGVAHKERLKKLRAAVDILTLTATPIPRTLNQAFSGIRDISVIATPPEDRLSIRTFVQAFSEEGIREAVEREMKRGGQVYFVHNRVLSMPAMERYLKEVVPGARIVTAHGQMGEERLSEAMVAFEEGRADILLCTAIIEAGLDIPNANTILINHAHRLGLAQLYQLRGRVGRDRHRAYAYFLVPKDVAMTREATQRLAVLEELTELGSGFKVASHDLEIRGAGNLLGKDQSGHIHQVGYELYSQLLAEAVAEVSGGTSLAEEEPEIDLKIAAFLPDDYIPEAGERLDAYRKLSFAKTVEAVDDAEMELFDRFGRLPSAAQALCDLSRLRARLRAMGVRDLRRVGKELFLSLSDRSTVDRHLLVQLVTKERGVHSFVRGEVLCRRILDESPMTILQESKILLNRLSGEP